MVKFLYAKRLIIGMLTGVILIIIGGVFFLKHLDDERILEKERNIRLDYKQWHLPEGASSRIGSGTVSAMQYSPDGNLLVVVSDIGVWIFNGQTAEPQHLLAAHTGVINSISFSADGSTLAIGTENGEVQLWNTSTGERLKTFTRQEYRFGVDNVFFMPNGHTLVVVYSSRVDLWDIPEGQRKNTLSAVENGMDDNDNNIPNMYMSLGGYNNSFSSDGKTIASDSNNDTFRFWDIATRKEVHTLIAEHSSKFDNFVAFSSDLRTLAIASYRYKGPRRIKVWEINLWDVNTGTRRKIFETDSFGIPFLVFSQDGNFLASLDNLAIHIWDVNTGEVKQRFKEYKSAVTSVAFSPDNQTLVSSSYDNTLRFFDVDTGKIKKTVTGYGALFRDVSLSADTHTLMSLCYGSNILRLWDSNTSQHQNNFIADKKYVTDAVLSPDRRWLAGSSILHNTIHLWNVNTGKLIKLKGPRRITGIAFSRDGEVLTSWGIAGNRKSIIQFYDVDTGRIERTLQLNDQESLSIHEDIYFDKKVFAGIGKYFDPNLFVWNLDTGDYKFTDVGVKEVNVARFSPDGRMLAIVGKTLPQQVPKTERNIVLWNVETGNYIRTLSGHTDDVKSITFSTDSRTLASGSQDETIRLWDIETGSSKVLTDPNWKDGYQRYEVRVTSTLAFSPDGQTLASGMMLGDIHLWKTGTGTKKKTLRGHSQRVSHLFFSPDGQTLISVSNDGTVLIWDLTHP